MALKILRGVPCPVVGGDSRNLSVSATDSAVVEQCALRRPQSPLTVSTCLTEDERPGAAWESNRQQRTSGRSEEGSEPSAALKQNRLHRMGRRATKDERPSSRNCDAMREGEEKEVWSCSQVADFKTGPRDPPAFGNHPTDERQERHRSWLNGSFRNASYFPICRVREIF